MSYGPGDLLEEQLVGVEEIPGLLGARPVTWVNVDGLGDTQVLRSLGETFGLHRLALEDVVNVHQRAKVEPYEGEVFIVTRMAALGDRFSTEQLSLFLGPGFVLTFQERQGDCFEPVRQRIRTGRGRLRAAGPDYLAYALLDAVMDHYFPVLERYSDCLDELEQMVLSDPSDRVLARVMEAKRDLLALRRAVWPHREAFNALVREPLDLVEEETRTYFRDCYDHTVQIIDVMETYRELASGLMDIYLSSLSNRMNEVMKVLTIIATIFIPLSFVAGLYGMNFDPDISPWNMPELSWYWGYPIALGSMGLVAFGMLLYFRRKGWLGGGSPHDGTED
jgi:magnesium transporter